MSAPQERPGAAAPASGNKKEPLTAPTSASPSGGSEAPANPTVSDKAPAVPYEIHPLANLFPMPPKAELQTLAENIAEHGLLNAATTLEGQILDGRRRNAGCLIAGVELRTTPLPPGVDPLAFVLAQNLHRRHLTASQRAVVAANLMPHYRAEAARRKQVLSGTRSNPDGSQPEVTEIVPGRDEWGEARKHAAKVAGANPKYVSDVLRLKRDAPELFKEVEAGTKTIPKAVKESQAKVPPTTARASGTDDFAVVLWDDSGETASRGRAKPGKTYAAKFHPNLALFQLYPTGAVPLCGRRSDGLVDVALFTVPLELAHTHPEESSSATVRDEHGVAICKADCQYLKLSIRGQVPETDVLPEQVVERGFPGVLRMVELMWPMALKVLSTTRDESPVGWEVAPRKPVQSAQEHSATSSNNSPEVGSHHKQIPDATTPAKPGAVSPPFSRSAGAREQKQIDGRKSGVALKDALGEVLTAIRVVAQEVQERRAKAPKTSNLARRLENQRQALNSVARAADALLVSLKDEPLACLPVKLPTLTVSPKQVRKFASFARVFTAMSQVAHACNPDFSQRLKSLGEEVKKCILQPPGSD